MDDLISRQKVCDWLKWYGNDAVKEGYKPSMIYAWKYIRDQIPSATPPHGDLIDKDRYRKKFMDAVYDLCADDKDNYRANALIDLYDNAPVIIPASEGAEEDNL